MWSLGEPSDSAVKLSFHIARDPSILLLGTCPGGIFRQDLEETSRRNAYHRADFGTRELKSHLEKCIHKNVVWIHAMEYFAAVRRNSLDLPIANG